MTSVGLLALQFSGFFIPLLVTPYLARTLELESFGILALAMGIAAYASVLIDWGFPLSGPQDVAKSRDDEAQLHSIFWDVTNAKALLAIICSVVLAGVAWAMGFFDDYAWLIAASSLQLVASVLSAGWFLQGLERMVRPSLIGLGLRLLTIPATFLLVHSPADVAVAAAIQSVAAVAGAVVYVVYTGRLTSVLRRRRFNLAGALGELQRGGVLFISMGSMSLFTYANVVVLGAVGGVAQAALFNGAERVRRAGQAMLSPLSNAFYPRINNLMQHNKAHASQTMFLLFVVQVGAAAILSLGVAVTAPWIVHILLGPEFTGAVPVLQIQCGIILLGGISNSLGTNMLLPMGLKSTFTVILVASGLLNILLLFLLIPKGGAVGASIAVLVTETLISISMAVLVYLHRERLRSLPAEGAR